MRKKAMGIFGGTRKRNEQDESDTGGKNRVEGCSTEVVGFLREELEQDLEFRSDGLQKEHNEKEARKKQRNQLIIQSQQSQQRQ